MKKRKEFEKLIKEKGYTCYSLAKTLGLAKSHVYQWCYGKQNPSIKHLILLKEILGISGDKILEIFVEAEGHRS